MASHQPRYGVLLSVVAIVAAAAYSASVTRSPHSTSGRPVSRTLSASAGDPEEDASSSGSYRRTYPDNYRPMRKEVDPAQATGRSSRAI